MRDFVIGQRSVRIDRPEEQPELSMEVREPYGGTETAASPRGGMGSTGSNDDVSLMESPREDIESNLRRKAPRIFKSLYFDADPNKIKAIQQQSYSIFIEASLEQYQNYSKKGVKKALEAKKERKMTESKSVHKMQGMSF